MKPSINAFLGYSYQQYITFLMLAKMDIEREIKEIEIEAIVDNNFDDIKISVGNYVVYCQIKDIDNISYNNLLINNNQVVINGKKHKLSEGINVLFFKDIDVTCNDYLWEFPAYKTSNVYIIPLSREKIGTIINRLYQYNEKRVLILNQFFNICLDKRHLNINCEELPIIETYDINLLEETINIGKKLLEFENILFVEGKPGVGKSHLVTCIEKAYKNCLIYRFWVSNQDKDYKARLIFQNFLSDISKKLFQDYRYRSEDEIIDYLNKNKKVLIIDGLDHVENYQNDELTFFINFIDKVKGKCKTIVLSRPLKIKIEWKKQQLTNWNFEETRTVLSELYHICDYQTYRDIFNTTNGYPILVRFIAEHYNKYNEVPLLGRLNSIDDYYNGIISNTNILSALALFLSTRSFIMESEISLFQDNPLLSAITREFIGSYPYLFEIKLNRISLFHDSLTTFLRKKTMKHCSSYSNVKQIVHKSLMDGEKRFMSRFASFDLDKSMKIEVVKKYASIYYFQHEIKNCIDFEAIRTFYQQIRESLTELDANELEIINYYDLSLIINITARDHISTINEFLYTYVKSLLFHGYGDDDITSSEHLFCMYYYYKTKDATLLHNLTSDSHYDTQYFYQKLNYDIGMEENYFVQHQKAFTKTAQLKRFLNQEQNIDSLAYVPHILANLYLHETQIKELKRLQDAIRIYLDTDENLGIYSLENALLQFKNVSTALSRTFLKNAKDIILSLGIDFCHNEYHIDSLKKLILINSSNGSFNVWPKIFNYIRLSLYEKRGIDISSVGYFFAMYGERKDYTVINIDEALKAFEDKSLINIDKSIDIITFTQSMSEKGISHLLNSYIKLHSPEIISTLLHKYHPDWYQITWFDLPKDFINNFPNDLFRYAMKEQLLKWHSHSREIDFKDIQNVFESNRRTELIERLNFFKYRIRIPSDHCMIQELENQGCHVISFKVEDQSIYIKTSQERYDHGILDADSIGFIKKNKLKVEDIAGYTDGNYSVFADLDIFKAYDKEHIKRNTLLIIHNALIGRIQTINMFASLSNFPGNMPAFVNEYDVDVNFEDLYKSFMSFLEISLLSPSVPSDLAIADC